MRDYIHVSDLAAAHVHALERLIGAPTQSMTLNCGYGRGFSVHEVLDSVDRVTNRSIERRAAPRRAGDPPALIADNARILATLPWRPERDDLDTIVADALAWERKLAERRLSGGQKSANRGRARSRSASPEAAPGARPCKVARSVDTALQHWPAFGLSRAAHDSQTQGECAMKLLKAAVLAAGLAALAACGGAEDSAANNVVSEDVSNVEADDLGADENLLGNESLGNEADANAAADATSSENASGNAQ